MYRALRTTLRGGTEEPKRGLGPTRAIIAPSYSDPSRPGFRVASRLDVGSAELYSAPHFALILLQHPTPNPLNMSFSFRGKTLNKIAVIGSGQIGPDIALFFTKVFAPLGVHTVGVDVSDEALHKGEAKDSPRSRRSHLPRGVGIMPVWPAFGRLVRMAARPAGNDLGVEG